MPARGDIMQRIHTHTWRELCAAHKRFHFGNDLGVNPTEHPERVNDWGRAGASQSPGRGALGISRRNEGRPKLGLGRKLVPTAPIWRADFEGPKRSMAPIARPKKRPFRSAKSRQTLFPEFGLLTAAPPPK